MQFFTWWTIYLIFEQPYIYTQYPVGKFTGIKGAMPLCSLFNEDVLKNS